MTLRRYRARIKLPIGTTEIVMEADSVFNCRQLLEAQYGAGSVIFGPVEMLSNE